MASIPPFAWIPQRIKKAGTMFSVRLSYNGIIRKLVSIPFEEGKCEKLSSVLL